MAAEKNIRTCAGCGNQFPKTSMVRIVRNNAGEISVDPSGRAPGRGTYICSAKCLAAATTKKKLGRALKTDISPNTAEDLAAALANHFASSPSE